MKTLFTPPENIFIKSDDNEISFIREQKDKNKKERTFVYKFTKSITKLNQEFEISESNLIKGLRNTFVEITNKH
jgi:hypothetical protein